MLYEELGADLVLHVGLPRTGTTFLQREVFPKLTNCNLMVKPYISHIEIKKDMLNLVSHEELYGNTADKYCPYYNPDPDHRFVIAERLSNMFPNARILVGVREPEDWLRSYYNCYVRHEGFTENVWTEDDFVENIAEGWSNHESYVEYLRDSFPEVYVYQFENLKKDSYAFVEGICEFLGRPTPNFDNIVRYPKLMPYQTKAIYVVDRLFRSHRVHEWFRKLIRIAQGYK